MLPWWHLATSLIVSYVLVASIGLNIIVGITWITIGCIFGTFIDLDHILYAVLIYKKDAWKVIKKGIIDPRGLIREFEKGGNLCFHAWGRMILHIITMLFVCLLSLNLFPSYFLLISLVFIAHLILDIDPRWLKY